MSDAPHFSFPLTRAPGGHLATVEQDTLDDIEARVLAFAHTREGEVDATPDFGHPDWTFLQQPIGPEQIAAEILDAVPGARVLVDEAPDRFDAAIDRITITLQGVSQ